MPTTNIFWRETFGMISVEAQHAGCRVVASKTGGLPETDCGGLILTAPDNPLALARGLVKAALKGPLASNERATAVKHFTVERSVDNLLKVIQKDKPNHQAHKAHLREGIMKLPGLPARQLALFEGRWKR